MRARGPRWGAVLLALAVSGCAVSPATRLGVAEKEQQRLAQELASTELRLQGVNAYLEQLRSPGKAGRSFSMYFTPASLEQLASQLLPMRMGARNFHTQLEGEVIVERLYEVRFGPMNTLTCKALLRGADNLRYTGKVPKGYEAELRKFQDGVRSGVVADMTVELSLSDTTLEARARATQTKLQSHSNSMAEGKLREQMNERTLRTPFTFDMSIPGSGAVPRRMVLSANHLVVTYAP
jgi:hypothetical protein